MKGRRILPLVAGGSQRLTYKDAGVDIDAGAELVKRIAKMASGIGGIFPFGILQEPLANIYLPLNLKIFNSTHSINSKYLHKGFELTTVALFLIGTT